jgi:HK97 family phage prohead protease
MPTPTTPRQQPRTERRTFRVELRAADGDTDAMPTISGYAAKFDRETVIGGWYREIIRAGAFERAAREDDVRALFNHDPNFVLGRTTSGTLALEEDATGLRIDVTPPDTQWARDLVETIRRGDVDQMSFAFSVVKERWERDETQTPSEMRELLEVRLYDVSPVTYPAYEDTEVSVRELVEGRTLDAASRAALSHLLGDEPAASGRTVAALRRRVRLAEALA